MIGLQVKCDTGYNCTRGTDICTVVRIFANMQHAAELCDDGSPLVSWWSPGLQTMAVISSVYDLGVEDSVWINENVHMTTIYVIIDI